MRYGTLTGSTSGYLLMIRASDRLLITGRTGTGKSYLARRIFEASPTPRLLIDPKNGEATAYAVTFSDPSRIPSEPVTRFVPRDPTDLDAYDTLYGQIFNGGPRTVWLDEARYAAPATGIPTNVGRVITQGRSRHIGHISCTQRPVWFAPELLSEAEHVISFATHNPKDIATLAGVLSVAPSRLAALLGELVEHGFSWFSVRENTITLCPPV